MNVRPMMAMAGASALGAPYRPDAGKSRPRTWTSASRRDPQPLTTERDRASRICQRAPTDRKFAKVRLPARWPAPAGLANCADRRAARRRARLGASSMWPMGRRTSPRSSKLPLRGQTTCAVVFGRRPRRASSRHGTVAGRPGAAWAIRRGGSRGDGARSEAGKHVSVAACPGGRRQPPTAGGRGGPRVAPKNGRGGGAGSPRSARRWRAGCARRKATKKLVAAASQSSVSGGRIQVASRGQGHLGMRARRSALYRGRLTRRARRPWRSAWACGPRPGGRFGGA